MVVNFDSGAMTRGTWSPFEGAKTVSQFFLPLPDAAVQMMEELVSNRGREEGDREHEREHKSAKKESREAKRTGK